MNHTLYLPDTGSHPQDIQNAHTLIIQDMRGFGPFLFAMPPEKKQQPRWLIDSKQPHWFMDYKKNHVLSVNSQPICFYRLAASLTFEIFKIEKKQPESFSLYLNYAANELAIGVPKRDNHKIAELKLNKPIRYRINGKSDFTMTGRKQRTFEEYDYFIEYIGQAGKIVFKDWNKIATVKAIPGKDYKLVEERKILK